MKRWGLLKKPAFWPIIGCASLALGVALSLALALVGGRAHAFPGMDKATPTDAPPPMAPVDAASPMLPERGKSAAPLSEAETKALLGKLAPTGEVRVRVVAPDGKPAAGAAVSLVVFVHDTPAFRLRGVTDAAGLARFLKVPVGEHARVSVTTAHGGVNYSEPAPLGKRTPEAEVTLRLAETTTDAKELRIARVHVIVDPSMQGIRITEVLSLRNAGKTTYAGAPLRIPLFEGAQQLEADRSSVPSLRLEGGALHFGGYLRPGDTQIQYDYSLPLTGSFARKTSLAIEKLFVVLTKPRFRLSGASLKKVKEMTRKGTSFLLAQGGPIAAGGSISFEIAPPKEMRARGAAGVAARNAGGAGASPAEGASEGGGGAPPAAGGGADGKPPEGMGVRGELVKDWRTVVRWLTPLFALMIFFIVVYLAGKKDDRAAAHDLATLVGERERLLAELATVTRETAISPSLQQGGKPAGHRGALRREAELTRRLADLYRAIDEQAALQALVAHAPASRGSSSATAPRA